MGGQTLEEVSQVGPIWQHIAKMLNEYLGGAGKEYFGRAELEIIHPAFFLRKEINLKDIKV